MDHVDIMRREDAQNGLMTICKVHSLQLSLPLSSCHLGVKNAGSEKLLPVCEKSLVSAKGLSNQQRTYCLGTDLSGFISSSHGVKGATLCVSQSKN